MARSRTTRSIHLLPLATLLTAACTTVPVSPVDSGGGGGDAQAGDVVRTDAVLPGADVVPADDAQSTSDVVTVADVVSPPADGGVPTPTWWKDIAPLVEERCTGCHVAGGIGPMPLDTYASASTYSTLMAAETGAKRMPPFLADETDCRPIKDSQALTPAQIALIAAWDTAGAPEGNPADYVAPPPPTNVLPTTPDLRVTMPADYLPNQTGTDDYHCFVLDPNLTEDKDVVGVRVNAGNPRVVHHVILYEVRTAALGQLQALDDAEPGTGYTCFGGPRIDSNFHTPPAGSTDLIDLDMQWIASWAPGGQAGYLPSTTGLKMKAGSKLVMEVHYNITSVTTHGMTDRSSVDLFYSPTPVGTQGLWIPIPNAGFRIPAGVGPDNPAATTTLEAAVDYPLRAWGAGPHMHLRGHSMRMDLLHSDGTSDCMLNVPRWDFHWQRGYWFQHFIRTATSGDKLRLSCTYDNTEANQPVIDGVRQAPHDLTWGETTNDEMCLMITYSSL